MRCWIRHLLSPIRPIISQMCRLPVLPELTESTITSIQLQGPLVEQVDQIARDEAAYIPLFFKHNIFGVRAGIQYTPSADDHILAWDFTF